MTEKAWLSSWCVLVVKAPHVMTDRKQRVRAQKGLGFFPQGPIPSNLPKLHLLKVSESPNVGPPAPIRLAQNCLPVPRWSLILALVDFQ